MSAGLPCFFFRHLPVYTGLEHLPVYWITRLAGFSNLPPVYRRFRLKLRGEALEFLACHINFSAGRHSCELAQGPSRVALALHTAGCSAPSGVTVSGPPLR